MSTEELLLNIEPLDLSFQFELNKQLSSSIRLSNNNEYPVAFKILSTKPNKYGVQPKIGILLPGSDCEIAVTKGALMRAPRDMKCRDKFMIRSAVASPGSTIEDVREMLKKDSEHTYQESILQVVYCNPTESAPLAPPSTENSNSDHVSEVTAAVDVTPEDTIPDTVFEEAESPVEECEVEVVDVSEQEENNNELDAIILTGVISSVLGLVSWYLMKRALSFIWRKIKFVMLLIVEMMKKLVLNSVEDWVAKILFGIVMHVLFGREQNITLFSKD